MSFPVNSPVNFNVLIPAPNGLPIAVLAGTTWNSGIFYIKDFSNLQFLFSVTQNTTVIINRYIDPAGVMPVGDPIIETVLSSGAPVSGSIAVNDGLGYSYANVSMQNTSGTTSLTTNMQINGLRPT